MIHQIHIAELRRQNRALLEQVTELTALVQEIPGLIAKARLDAIQGKQTKYDYRRVAKACKVRI